jgi:hypothetical protein
MSFHWYIPYRDRKLPMVTTVPKSDTGLLAEYAIAVT